MNLILILKGVSLLVSTVLVIIALVRLSKKKEHFQIFPDSIKKEYFKEVKLMTIMNIFSVVLILISFTLIKTNLFFIVSLVSMFLSINSILQLHEDFDEITDSKPKEEKKKKK